MANRILDVVPAEPLPETSTDTKMPFPTPEKSCNVEAMRPRVLVAVVDDEESVCRALLRLLRATGLDVETFSSSVDFLESIRERLPSRRPDCLVLDLHLPGLTGIDVLRQLKAERIPLPIIMITGNEEAGVQEQVLSEGAQAFLVKPINARNLLDAIEHAVRGAPPARPLQAT
ncbi:MAG TPA: response regulator [Thermoanaerobaculia bacterium]|nr:response regulator [Thermoanaerobaculia bacterium]